LTGSAAPVADPILFTQVPWGNAAAPTTPNGPGLVRQDWFSGARLVVRSPDGRLRVLSEGFDSACDPNVSFDGLRVLFAGKRARLSRWRIWEIDLDGRGLRAVSPEHLDARSPIHASTLFTLESPQPWFTTIFVGQEKTLNEVGQASASSLYNIKLDGTELRRLTFNPNHNFDPVQMWDGRVIYSAERYPNEPGGREGRVGLYALHVEGADMEFYGGGQGGRIQHMACATERGLVVFVEPAPGTWDGAGQLAGLQERRPHVTYRRLSQDPSHLYLYPSPLQHNRVLVSRRAAQGGDTCGVFWFDADQGRGEPVYDSPDYHDVQAVLAKSRPTPDGHSTVVDTKYDFGTFYGLNCYDADPRLAPHLPSGAIKRVRFIEGVLQTAPEASAEANGQGPFVARRLVGEAPVEVDGSFNVAVPADTPLLLQTLDERGLALANCGWIWVKTKETRGCIGCHEDPERTPENEYVLALRRPSNQLTLPPAQRRSVSFREDIAPLLQRHCAATDCHGGEDTPLRLGLTSPLPSENELEKVYAALLAPARDPGTNTATWPQAGKYVDPGRARTSWLIWQLSGEDTSRPWDHVHSGVSEAARQVRLMPPSGKAASLSPTQIRTFIQWIDLGAQYGRVNDPGPVPSDRQTR
jgi:hypothetical protein